MNKSIKTFFTSHHYLQLIYDSSIHNTASSESGEKYAQIKTIYKRKLSKRGINKYVGLGFGLRGEQGMDFFTRRSVIVNYGLVLWPEVMV